jgi:hypothetical protein
VGKPEGKRPLGRPRREWTILKCILKTGWGGMDWIDLVQDNEPSGSIKCWELLEWLHNWLLLKKGSATWS